REDPRARPSPEPRRLPRSSLRARSRAASSPPIDACGSGNTTARGTHPRDDIAPRVCSSGKHTHRSRYRRRNRPVYHPSLKKALAFAWFAFTFAASASARAQVPFTNPLSFTEVVRVTPRDGAHGELAPIVRIVSPLADARVAPGEGRIGTGSPNGAGFA